MEIFNSNPETFWGLLLSGIPFFIWIGFLYFALFSPFDTLLKALRGKPFSWPKFFLIASFFASGPMLLILGIVILVFRYKKASPEEKAHLDNQLKVLKEQAQHLKEKTQNVSPEIFGEQLPDFLKEKLPSKPSEKSMQAAITVQSSPFKQDHGVGRALLLVILFIVLGFSYWIWKSDIFQIEVNKSTNPSRNLIDR